MKLPSLLSIRLLPRVFSVVMVAMLLSGCNSGTAGTSDEPNIDKSAFLNPAPTAAEGELTVGDLIMRVDAAWSGVESMRITSMSGPVPTEGTDSSPVPQGSVTTEEWVAPNNRRLVERVSYVVTNEEVYINGKVYMWGMFVATSVAPEVGAGTWVTLDPEVIPPDTPVGYHVAHITRESGTPFGMISNEMRDRPAKEAGTVQVGGRSCTLYSFVDTTQMGERIDYELALDADDLPCQHVMRAGGFQNSTVFEFNNPDIQIIAPDAPTSVSGTPEG